MVAKHADAPSLNLIALPRAWAGKMPLYLPLSKAVRSAARSAPKARPTRYEPMNMRWEDRRRIEREREDNPTPARDPHKFIRELKPLPRPPHEMTHDALVRHYTEHNLPKSPVPIHKVGNSYKDLIHQRNVQTMRNVAATVALPPEDQQAYQREIAHQRRSQGLPPLRVYPTTKLYGGAAGVNRHRQLVADALKAGKKVPRGVSAQLPDYLHPEKRAAFAADEPHKLTRREYASLRIAHEIEQGRPAQRRPDAHEQIGDWHEGKVLDAIKAGKAHEIPESSLRDHAERRRATIDYYGNRKKRRAAGPIETELARRVKTAAEAKAKAKAEKVDKRSAEYRASQGITGRKIAGKYHQKQETGPEARAARRQEKAAKVQEAIKQHGAEAVLDPAELEKLRAKEGKQSATAMVESARKRMGEAALESPVAKGPKVAKTAGTPTKAQLRAEAEARVAASAQRLGGAKDTPSKAPPQAKAQPTKQAKKADVLKVAEVHAPAQLKAGGRVLANHPDTGEYVGTLGLKGKHGYPVTPERTGIKPRVHPEHELAPLPKHPQEGAPLGRRHRSGSRVAVGGKNGGYIGTVKPAGDKDGHPLYEVTPTNSRHRLSVKTLPHRDLLPAPAPPVQAKPVGNPNGWSQVKQMANTATSAPVQTKAAAGRQAVAAAVRTSAPKAQATKVTTPAATVAKVTRAKKV